MFEKINRRQMLTGLMASPLLASLPAMGFERTADGKVIVIGGNQAIPVLDPHVRYDWSTRMVQQAVYDALFKYEGNPAQITPWLAQSWDTSADGKVWTFKLVEGVQFNNGDPLDAEAVRYSFARALTLNKGVAWMLKEFLAPEDVTVVDAHTVRFALKAPYAPFMSVLPWWYIVNPKEVQAHEQNGDYGQAWLTDHAAGSGPFVLGRWQPNVLYELKSVANYWKGWPHPRPAGVIYRLMIEPAARKAALQRGEIDLTMALSNEDYTLLGRMPGMVIESHAGSTTFGIKFNTQRGPTADVNLRKAIAYAMDYDALLAVLNGAATLQTSPFPHAVRGHVDVPGMPRRDLTKAREYLAKSAHPNGNLRLKYVHINGFEEARRIGLVLLDNLRDLNIAVELTPETWPTMVANGSRVETAPDMTSVYTTPISTDPDAVAYQYHPDSWGQYYAMHHYDNKDVARMIEAARAEMDWDKRAALYTRIQAQVVADQPEVFGMLANRIWAMRDYVKGFRFCPVRLTGEVDLYQLHIDA